MFSCSPENDDFWHFLYSKDTPGTRFLSRFILHRPVCQNRRAHDIIPLQKWCDQNLRSILKSQNFDLKFRSKRMPCKRVPATVTVRSVRPVTVAVAGPHLLHRLCNFRNLTGPRCLCQIFVALGGSVVVVAGPLRRYLPRRRQSRQIQSHRVAGSSTIVHLLKFENYDVFGTSNFSEPHVAEPPHRIHVPNFCMKWHRTQKVRDRLPNLMSQSENRARRCFRNIQFSRSRSVDARKL